MKATYFFSDVHLGLGTNGDEKTKENRLLVFLRAIQSTTKELFILGDLFDFWFEYRTVIPKGFHRTLSAIQQFTDGGIPVHYLTGNHDFWMGDYFSEELGITMHRDPFETRIDDKRVFLHHGDGLAEKDFGYRLIKPVLRNRFSIWMYRWVHPDLGVRLARGSSRASRKHTGLKDFGEMDGMKRFAGEKIKAGVDVVMMGHRHEPLLERIGNGVYINLGDWITTNTYAVMRNGDVTLESWKGTQ